MTVQRSSAPGNRLVVVALLISIVLVVAVFVSYKKASSRSGTIVLPGGITYLGPTPAQSPELRTQSSDKVVISSDDKWVIYQGKKFPYSFEYPESLSLGVFPNDPYDAVTIFYSGTDSNTNIFFRVEDLNKLNKKDYLDKPMEYTQNWWKDYATWKGVESVTQFTNNQGLVGYRAKYLDNQGKTPYDHVFFAVPNRPELVLWLSGRLFPPEVFDRLVHSVSWKK